MKKKTLMTICLLAFAGILFSSCKRDPPTPPSQAELIKGNWSLIDQKSIAVVNGQESSSETYVGKPGDLVGFGTNGKVIINIDGDQNSSTYQVLPNNKLLIDDDEGTIAQLDTHNCILIFKIGPAEDFENLTIRLKK